MNFEIFSWGLLICFFLSFALGVERQIRRRFVGLRTMILVAVGSYLFVSFSFLLENYSVDASRVAAQVVAGIGFLGAGVIIKDGKSSKVRGLTTAATLWCDASIGVLCAGGFVAEAILATSVVLFSNIILRYINNFINEKVSEKTTFVNYELMLTITKDKRMTVKEKLMEAFSKDDIEVDSYNVTKDTLIFEIILRKSDNMKLEKVVDRIVRTYDINDFELKKNNEIKNEEVDE